MTSRNAAVQERPVGNPLATDAMIRHMPLFATAFFCLLTVAGIFWLRAPGSPAPTFSGNPTLPAAVVALPEMDVVVAASPEPADPVPVPTVTRAAAPDVSLAAPLLRKPGVPISHQLRQPIRLIGTDPNAHDLRSLTQTALETFGHNVSQTDTLQDLLVMTLSEGQPDAYVDAVLNAASDRGDFQIPKALLTVSGRLDTDTLLAMVLQVAKGAANAPSAVQSDHVLTGRDSLAGLALRYYGTPGDFLSIVAANLAFADGITGAEPGTRIAIPTL